MKVIEYCHGTIKNYRYDRDVSGGIAMTLEGRSYGRGAVGNEGTRR